MKRLFVTVLMIGILFSAGNSYSCDEGAIEQRDKMIAEQAVMIKLQKEMIKTGDNLVKAGKKVIAAQTEHIKLLEGILGIE